MKILFISDIHGITTNLSKIENIINQEKIDKFVVLGDLYYTGPNYYDNKNINSGYVKDFLTKYKSIIICLKGNCDSDVDVKASDFPICNDLALINFDNINIYCTHGNKYNMENNHKFKRKDILVYGHLHYPFIVEKEGIIYINTGSISLPRNNSVPSYLIYDNKRFILYNIDGSILEEYKVNY